MEMIGCQGYCHKVNHIAPLLALPPEAVVNSPANYYPQRTFETEDHGPDYTCTLGQHQQHNSEQPLSGLYIR